MYVLVPENFTKVVRFLCALIGIYLSLCRWIGTNFPPPPRFQTSLPIHLQSISPSRTPTRPMWKSSSISPTLGYPKVLDHLRPPPISACSHEPITKPYMSLTPFALNNLKMRVRNGIGNVDILDSFWLGRGNYPACMAPLYWRRTKRDERFFLNVQLTTKTCY